MSSKSAEYQRRWRAKNKAHEQQYRSAYVAKNQDEIRAKSRARNKRWREENPGRDLQWRKENPEAAKAINRACYQRNRDKNLAKQKAYRQANQPIRRLLEAKRRAGTSGKVTAGEWETLLEVFDHRCAYCLVRSDNLQVEHFRPLSRGGEHQLENIVPACPSCNAAKAKGLIFAWSRRLVGGTASAVVK